MLQVGGVINGRYRIERMIGMGGFGVVAAATHLELRHEVAIKMVRPEFTEDAEIIDRFLREARAVAGLKTDHVCRVFDIGRTEQGVPYIVMELLQGSDVAAMLRVQPLRPAIAVDFILQACRALAEAHPRGIVHRDLKPPNLFVMRRPDGTSLVKVLDFGIAKAVDELRLTHSSVVLRSPQYMSPEQLTTPKDVDARTDIWSVGVTLYHMVARRLPFPSAQVGELAVMITSEPPAPLDEIDPGLRAVIWKCLEKRREARFQDVNQLAAALTPFSSLAAPPPAMTPYVSAPLQMPSVSTVATLATNAPAPSPSPAPVPAASRTRHVLLGILAVSVLGVGGTIGYLALSSNKSAPAKIAAPSIDAAAAKVAVAVDAALVVDVAPEIDAAPVKVAVAADAGRVVKVAPPVDAFKAPHSGFELELAKLEGRIGATPPSAPEMPSLYMSAVQMACVIKDIDKAKLYFGKLVDADKKQAAVEACRAYNITL